jgi:hypothetical protein
MLPETRLQAETRQVYILRLVNWMKQALHFSIFRGRIRCSDIPVYLFSSALFLLLHFRIVF